MMKTMLDSGMREAANNSVDLSEHNADIVKTVVNYMYTSKLGDQAGVEEDKVTEILRAADFFVLPGLRLQCEMALIPRLKVANAVDMVILAYQCNANKLGEAAKTFMVRNSGEIVKEEGWKEKLKRPECQDLVIDILEASMKK